MLVHYWRMDMARHGHSTHPRYRNTARGTSVEDQMLCGQWILRRNRRKLTTSSPVQVTCKRCRAKLNHVLPFKGAR